MWDVMGDRERALNQRGLIAFEGAEANLNVKSLPGFEIDKVLMKEDHKKSSTI